MMRFSSRLVGQAIVFCGLSGSASREIAPQGGPSLVSAAPAHPHAHQERPW